MNTPNPVTPAPAAAPGTNEPVNDNSNVVTSAPSTAEGKEPKINNDGTNVTIPISEYKNLNRSNARLKSLQKRNALGSSKQTLDTTKSYDNADPDVVEELHQTNDKLSVTTKELFKERLGNKTRDLLAKDEFKNLPESTKRLILKNPSSLSKAESVDEAILDIEDFVNEEVAGLNVTPNSQQLGESDGVVNNASSQAPITPSVHDTPPAVNAGSPAQPNSEGMEDVSKLTGTDKTRAIIRNGIKKVKGTKV